MKTPNDTFSYKGVVYGPGTLVADDSEVATKYPTMFRDAAPDGPVERATARPGEKRTTKRAAVKPKVDTED